MKLSPVRTRLLSLVQRQRTARLWRRLGLCWLTGCLVGLGVVAATAATGWIPRAVLPGLLILCGLGAVMVWVRHRKTQLDWRDCARKIESRRRELNGRLLTAIEQQPDEHGRFTYLQERLMNEVLAHDRMFSWEQSFPASRLGLTKLAHALAFAAFLVTCLRLGTLQSERPDGIQTARGVVVTPGDTLVERGDRVVVMVRFNTRVPAAVDLTVRPAAGGSVQRIPLVKSLEDPVFGGSIPEISEDVQYVVEYAGHRSRPFEVRVFDYPRLERVDADLTYPDYTGLPPRRIENTRHITAVQGTQVQLSLELNKRVNHAQLLPRNDERTPVILTPDPTLPRAALTGFVLSRSERYALQLVDADGRTNNQTVQLVFQALSNRAPELEIASPRHDLRPSALQEIRFAGTVFDDFGVSAYGFAYLVGGEDIRTVELGRQVAGQEKRSFSHVLALEDLGVQPGDLVSWFFWSEDAGPDGGVRRTLSDLHFAEIRPFEEIFRQGQPQFGQTGAGQPSGGGGGGQTGRLLDLQQQIIHATWKLQRQQGTTGSPVGPWEESSIPTRSGRGAAPGIPPDNNRLSGWLQDMLASSQHALTRPSLFHAQRLEPESASPPIAQSSSLRSPDAEPVVPSSGLGGDLQVVLQAQQDAILQAREARSMQQDPAQTALWDEAIEQMESALDRLRSASNSPAAFPQALAAQQAAYQRLLKLQDKDYSVSRNRNQNGAGAQTGRQQQRRGQLDQLELTPEESRYETERLAQAPQSAEQREQLQVMSRLAELARRQADINERLQELQIALQAAPTEEARRRLRQELKRLQEEQQQMLSDLDGLQQRLDSQENQSRFSNQREQIEQTRESVQRAAEAAGQGTVSEALAAGTRAEREMQQMRQDLRSQSASAFAEDIRQLRSDARELARQQAELQEQIESLDDRGQMHLGDSEDTLEVQRRLQEQRRRLTNVVGRASQLSQLAEEAEPVMSGQLYDTLREFSQDDLGAVKELQEVLLANSLFPLYERLKVIANNSDAKTLDMTSAVLDEGFPGLGRQTGQRAVEDMNDLARGIEQAAELVVGDDTEALRRALQQLQELTDQLQQEVARATSADTNAPSLVSTNGTGVNPSGSFPPEAGQPRDPARASTATSGAAGTDPSTEEPGADDGREGADAPGVTGGRTASTTADSPAPTDEFDLETFLQGGPGAGDARRGPIAGDGFGPWSEGLREVEELMEVQDLRNPVRQARERARQLRRDYTRHRQKPDWARVNLQVVQPLVEVQSAIGQELRRRESREDLVPIDRDPVPDRYDELVRRYYEELGKDSH